MPWAEDQLAAAASKFSGSTLRGFLLYQHTDLRGSDVVRLGPTDVDTFQGRDAFAIVTQKRVLSGVRYAANSPPKWRCGSGDRVRSCCSETASRSRARNL